MATTDIYSIAGDIQTTRHCIRFLGGDVDDGIQIDAAAAAAVSGNHTKGTITAWVMVPDVSGTYTIFGAGDANAVEYMLFDIAAGKLQFFVSDGGATRVDFITTNIVLKPHRWHHVALVQDGSMPKFYVDGEEITAVTRTTATEPGQWFDDTDGIDGAHIGAADSVGGAGALTQEFKGYISDFHLFSDTAAGAALSAAEVKKDMNGAATATYLQNSYNMDGQVDDAGTGADNGTIVGAIIYCDANEFASRLSFGSGTPVTADNVVIAMNGNIAIGFVIQAA